MGKTHNEKRIKDTHHILNDHMNLTIKISEKKIFLKIFAYFANEGKEGVSITNMSEDR